MSPSTKVIFHLYGTPPFDVIFDVVFDVVFDENSETLGLDTFPLSMVSASKLRLCLGFKIESLKIEI